MLRALCVVDRGELTSFGEVEVDLPVSIQQDLRTWVQYTNSSLLGKLAPTFMYMNLVRWYILVFHSKANKQL